jgi:hypothetical protein
MTKFYLFQLIWSILIGAFKYFVTTFSTDGIIGIKDSASMLMFMVFPNKTKRTMTSEELRAIQAPIKANYKENPEAGIFTLKVKGKAGEGITCSIETGKAFIQAGLHPATGGDGLSLCSGASFELFKRHTSK